MGELRVIAGTWKGHRISAGPQRVRPGIRPTSDRVRTSLFDRLAGVISGACVLDLCAGTGALGIEALSRGASEVTFIESSPPAVRLLKANLNRLGAESFQVRIDDALRALAFFGRVGGTFDLILADPPYGSGLAPRIADSVDQLPVLNSGGLLVVEHDRREMLPAGGHHLTPEDERRYGDTLLTFFRGR